jgi:pyruvate/2-oxoglutarate dehydrogenase complex dihydrolipoamide dehydrogenase (E3) component
MADIFDLLVIGAGSGGLSVAAGAAQMGARVALFEAGEMGGDCLNVGCVPSKALIAAGAAAEAFRSSANFGVAAVEPQVDFARVMAHVREVIAAIEPNDSQARFEALGVTVIRERARFSGPRRIVAGDRPYAGKRIVVATGSKPALPPVDGLAQTPHLTNESVWELSELPRHLIVLGGGAIGCELAQAFRRLGSAVTIVEAFSLMSNDDPELVAVVRQRLVAEGIAIHEHAVAARADGHVRLTLTSGAVIEGSHLLVAAGRKPNVDDLGLEAAGITVGKRGISVDARLRTSNRHVFAIGDCREGPQFTHAAGYDAGIVIRNALFRLPAKANYAAMPWATYTDPELAQVGLTEAKARERYGDAVTVYRWPFHDNDRAQAERRTEGLVKLVLAKGRPVGCGIAGAHAGELIHSWALALSAGLKPSAIAGMVAPYPTLGEASKRAVGAIYTPALFSKRTRRLVRLLLKLP